MIRKFLPVGQGAFYVEQFKDGKNVVYDCGSSTNIDIVKREIKNTFSKGEAIEAVFISHMHDDHINGLEMLLKYCNVRTVYIPYLTTKEKSLTKVIRKIEKLQQGDWVGRFIDNPYETILSSNDSTRIIYVDTERNNEEITYEIIPNSNNEIINSGSKIEIYKNNAHSWVYIPYNFREKSRKQKFLSQLLLNGVEINKLMENLNDSAYWKENLTEIEKAYYEVSGSLNTNSMVVYSGPDYADLYFHDVRMCRNHCYHYCYSHKRCGCIFMGDYDASGRAKWEQLSKSYEKYWENIGTIQIPHHGSRHNYNEEMSSNGSILVISSGFSNKYRHPHSMVIKDILESRSPVFWVTEKSGSTAEFHIDGV